MIFCWICSQIIAIILISVEMAVASQDDILFSQTAFTMGCSLRGLSHALLCKPGKSSSNSLYNSLQFAFNNGCHEDKT